MASPPAGLLKLPLVYKGVAGDEVDKEILGDGGGRQVVNFPNMDWSCY